MQMRFAVLDFETHFDSKTYTLSAMTTESYIRDPRFQAHGAAIKWQDNIPARWYADRELRQVLKEEDWSDVFLISHHSQFDHLILSHHYDVHPRMSGCTLSMARLLIGNHLSVSLDSVRKHFGMPGKTTPYHLFDGKHWKDIPQAHQELIGEGACDEVESIWTIFKLLMKDFPVEELEVVDQTIKMFSEPVLRGDVDLLAKVWEREALKKRDNMAALNVIEADLQSSKRFAQLLRDEGVEPEMKDGKNKPIFAFAKTDQFMRDLLEDDNERVRTLAEARLGVKSTLMQSRAETLGFMATRGFGGSSSPMPVYLRYCLSGDSTIYTLAIDGEKQYKRLDTLRDTDKVWDGAEFVQHGGLVYQGRQSVIEWDSVQATPDHRVYLPDGTEVSISEAKSRRLPLMGAGISWQNHRPLDRSLSHRLFSRRAHSLSVPMWFRRFGEAWQYCAAQKSWLPSLQQSEPNACGYKAGKQKSRQPLEQYQPTLYFYWAQILPRLWGARNQEQICYPQGFHFVGTEVFATPHLQSGGNRAHRQRRTLRTEQPEVGNAQRAVSQPAPNSAGRWGFYHGFLRQICSVAWRGARYLQETSQARFDWSANTRAHKNLRERPKKIDVFDIYMCGPRNQFAVNGKIVSNCGAHTTRWAGGDSSNFQNLKRGSDIRKAIMAPEGYLLAPIDLAQIECRILNYLAGEENVINAFREKRDLYSEAASRFYGRTITRNDPAERNLGKVLELGCGYGMGAAKFQNTCRVGALSGQPIILSTTESEIAVRSYRESHPHVTAYWKTAGRMIARIAGGEPTEWGPMLIRDKMIFGPGGTMLDYRTLEHHEPTGEEIEQGQRDGYWRIKTRQGWSKLYSGRLVENVVQWLARIVMSQAMIRIARRGYCIVNTTHDELLVLVPIDGREQEHLAICMAEMKQTPVWLPGIPLDAEGSLSERYSK